MPTSRYEYNGQTDDYDCPLLYKLTLLAGENPFHIILSGKEVWFEYDCKIEATRDCDCDDHESLPEPRGSLAVAFRLDRAEIEDKSVDELNLVIAREYREAIEDAQR